MAKIKKEKRDMTPCTNEDCVFYEEYEVVKGEVIGLTPEAKERTGDREAATGISSLMPLDVCRDCLHYSRFDLYELYKAANDEPVGETSTDEPSVEEVPDKEEAVIETITTT